MTDIVNVFSFSEEAVQASAADFVAHIPSFLRERDLLFDTLAETLKFPEYFGKNWDALSDCLRDLSWIKQQRVIIVHSDLPLSSLDDRSKYLAVLSDCIKDWKAGETHSLVVVFPPQCHTEISRLAASCQ
jgi:RNAse (barnase) inhibitor barstar